MAIYTKRGDKGKTSLYDKANRQDVRVDKDSTRVKAIGAIDELNSFLGICLSFNGYKSLKDIQKDLFTIGSILAGAKLRFSKTKTIKLEREIDKLEGRLPVLKNFILPGGSPLSSHLQYARALARRTERRVVVLSKEDKTKPQILSYLNRLSDFLFMLARKSNFDWGIKEEAWIGKRKW
ncbi:cob(I)yrinic acid a,c-diamide adenosyltransferase [Candidatus Woesebacteria bacterium]|nr:cob(I)yrinic acid a,c-diamide adenosyltransferase [Candidatus Woesebacteria bacterium]